MNVGPRTRTLLALSVLALPPALLAVLQLGRIHPDELFQTLEPALFRARGYGILAWEWQPQAGLRNWAVPLFFAQLLKLSDAAGITHPRIYRAVLEVPQALLHLWSLSAVLRYARRRLPPRSAWLAVTAVALYGPLLVFAGRTLGESFSGAFLLIALEALDRTEQPLRGGWVGGLALGLAVVVRYGSGVFVLAFLAGLVLRRAWRTLGACCLAGGLVAAGLGVLDAATWGQAFHSLRAYVQFNIVGGGAAAQFGASPAWFYLPWLLGLTPLWAWWGFARSVRRGPPYVPLGLWAGALYVLAVSLTPHKEERFLYPALVLLVTEGAIGTLASLEAAALSEPRRRWAWALMGLLGLASYGLIPAQRGAQFRAIAEATRDPATTGFLLVNEGVWGSGGYFYMGKQVPFALADDVTDPRFFPAVHARQINRASTYDNRGLPELLAAGFHVVGRDGAATWLAR